MSSSSDDLRVLDTQKEAQNSDPKSESNLRANSKPEESAPAPINVADNPHIFPEGGTQAWLTVAGAASFLFVSFGWISSIGIFQEYYQANQLKDYTPSQISWIPSLMRMPSFLASHSSGRIVSVK